MTTRTEHVDSVGIDVNNFWPLATAMYLAVLGPQVFIVQPGWVQGLVELLGFAEDDAGFVASAEMYGIATTTIAMSFISHKVNWRHITALALAVICAGNIGSVFITELNAFMAIRFVVGLGCGFLVSLGFAIVGLTRAPERNFAWLIVWVLSYGAAVLYFMPSMFAIAGFKSFLIFLAVFTALAAPLIRFVPHNGEEQVQTEADAVDLPGTQRLLGLAAVLCYFLGQGVIWAYLFLIGLAGGPDESQISHGLTLSQFAGIAGGLTSAWLGIRLGRTWPLALAILGTLLPLSILFDQFSALAFAIAIGIYNYAWNIVHPFLFAAIASFDRSGRIVVHAASMQMLGLATGPAVAALMVSDGGFSGVIVLGMLLFAGCLACILPPLATQRRLLSQGG